MSSLYELDQAIYSLIDPETGEIGDFEKLEALSMERDKKIENIVNWIKNEKALLSGIKAEKEAMESRMKSCESTIKRLTDLLDSSLQGQGMETPSFKITYRKSPGKLVIDDESQLKTWLDVNAPDLLKQSEPTIDKTGVKKSITAGREIPHCKIESGTTIVIK